VWRFSVPQWIDNRVCWFDLNRLESISPAPALIRVAILVFPLVLGMLAQDPAILAIRIVEGDGAVYAMGSRSPRGLTVQVTDETGKPIEAAAVSFRLPDSGPSGTFASGSRTEIVATRADGQAGVWGMQWNRTAGTFEIRITAVKGQTRAGTVCRQSLSDSAEAGSKTARAGPRASHKWLWIALGVAGAAGAGVALTAARGGKPGETTPSNAVQIGAPSINLGHP
jgi:hypothetical protein